MLELQVVGSKVGELYHQKKLKPITERRKNAHFLTKSEFYETLKLLQY